MREEAPDLGRDLVLGHDLALVLMLHSVSSSLLACSIAHPAFAIIIAIALGALAALARKVLSDFRKKKLEDVKVTK